MKKGMYMQKGILGLILAIIVALIILGGVAYVVMNRMEELAVKQAKAGAVSEGIKEVQGMMGRLLDR
jgi:L-asparagine transporter-like permease